MYVGDVWICVGVGMGIGLYEGADMYVYMQCVLYAGVCICMLVCVYVCNVYV